MIVVRRQTVSSLLFITLIVGVAIARSWDRHYVEPTVLATAVWLVPILLSHCVRSQRHLFCFCALFSVGLAVALTAAMPAASRALDRHLYYVATAVITPTLGVLPVFGTWWEFIAKAALSAPIYGLVGVLYARTCAPRLP